MTWELWVGLGDRCCFAYLIVLPFIIAYELGVVGIC